LPPFYSGFTKNIPLWYLEMERLAGDKQYTAGYGGLAIYEVSIGQSSIYDWYKYHEEPSHEHGNQ